MSARSRLCWHDQVHFCEYDHGIEPGTGFHDAGATFTCMICGEVFTEKEWLKECEWLADQLEHKRKAIRSGSHERQTHHRRTS